MLIGYMRVSKSDGSQTLDPQRDALLEAGVAPDASIRILPQDGMMPGQDSWPVSRPSSLATL